MKNAAQVREITRLVKAEWIKVEQALKTVELSILASAEWGQTSAEVGLARLNCDTEKLLARLHDLGYGATVEEGEDEDSFYHYIKITWE